MDPPATPPEHERVDTTTSMVTKESNSPLRFTELSPSPDARLIGTAGSALSGLANARPLVLLQQCVVALGGPGDTLTDPANELALALLLEFLDAALQGDHPDECISFVPAPRYSAL